MTWSYGDGYREVKVDCIPTPAPCPVELRGAELHWLSNEADWLSNEADWLSNEADDEEWLVDMELQNLVKVKVMTLDPYAEPVEVNRDYMMELVIHCECDCCTYHFNID